MIEIIDCDQGSEEWFTARLGIPTASEFSTVIASGKGGGESITRRKYLYRLAGEIITGKPEETYSNGHMERGKVMEVEARAAYEMTAETWTMQIGFIRNGAKGCSPDSLVGADGMLEIKTKLPSIMIDVLFRDDVPPEHKAQVQGALWVAEREWLDFVAFWPGMPIFIKRVTRDEEYIKRLSEAVDAFNSELNEIVKRVRGYETPAVETSSDCLPDDGSREPGEAGGARLPASPPISDRDKPSDAREGANQ
jgi:hypothetical protein